MPNGALSQHQVDTPYTAADIRFTRKGDFLYAWLMAWPQDGKAIVTSLPESQGKVTKVELLGHAGAIPFQQTTKGLEVELPRTAPGKFAWGLKIQYESSARP